MDGHGSHINMPFLNWCNENKILVAVYPPHSTHRLQPLDVSVFSPLGVYYSQELDKFLHDCQGLCSVTKRDFLRLFWPAWIKALTAKNSLSGWKKTGLYPFNPLEILDIFKPKEIATRPSSSDSGNSILSASDWKKLKGLLRDVVAEELDEFQHSKVDKLSNTILAITTENAILKAENKGFQTALNLEKKKRKRGKGLFEELRANDNNSATFFSPKKIEQALAIQARKEQEKVDQQAAKQLEKEESRAKAQQRKVAVQLRKEERSKIAAERAAQKLVDAANKQRDKETKQATRQLQDSLQQSAKKPRSRKQVLVEPLVEVLQSSEAQKPEAEIQGRSQPTRGARQRHKLQL